MISTLLSGASTKAWAAAVVTVLTALVLSLADSSADGSGISLHEGLTALGAGLVALGVVFGVSNTRRA